MFGKELGAAVELGRELQRELGLSWPGLKPGGFSAPLESTYGQFMSAPQTGTTLPASRSSAPTIQPGTVIQSPSCACCVVCPK